MNRLDSKFFRLSLVRCRRYSAPVRLLIFAVLLLLMWLPIALPLHWLIRDSNLASIVTLVILYFQFLWLVRWWGKAVHRQSRILWVYGLEISQRILLELLLGLAIGLVSVSLLIGVESGLGWVTWSQPSATFPRIVLEGLLVSVAIGFAEELLFRGWVLDELQRDYAPIVVLWANAIIFATLHLRLVIVPAMVLLGVALVWAKRSSHETFLGKRRDRLGLPIGLHAGLVWGNYILEVGKLIQYTGNVPAWVTGLDRNPLAGVIGVLFMGGLALGMWQFAKRSPFHPIAKR